MWKCLLVLLTLSFVSAAIAGPWVQPVAFSGYAQFSYTPMRYSSGIGSRINKSVTDNTYQFYSEISLGKGWGTRLIVPFKEISSRTPIYDQTTPPIMIDPVPEDGSTEGLGNVFIEVSNYIAKPKFFFSKRKNRVSMGYSVAVMLPAMGLDLDKQLYTGYNAFGMRPELSFGKSGQSYYSFLDLAYLDIFNGYTDLFQLEAEYGRSVRKKKTELMLVISLNSSIPVNDMDENLVRSRATLLYSDGAGYVSPGIKAIYKWGNGVELNSSVFGAIWGKYIAAVPSFTFGIGYKWTREKGVCNMPDQWPEE